MKNKKLKKRLKNLEAIVSSNRITLTDPNDENMTAVIQINDDGDFETSLNLKSETNQKTIITTF